VSVGEDVGFDAHRIADHAFDREPTSLRVRSDCFDRDPGGIVRCPQRNNFRARSARA
jgi:hypothetical protein